MAVRAEVGAVDQHDLVAPRAECRSVLARHLLIFGAAVMPLEPGEAGPPARPLHFLRLRNAAILPEYAHPGEDAALDLRACEGATVPPLGRVAVPTGWALGLPPGHVGLVLPRSGQALRRGLFLANPPGCIDPGYRGEVTVAVFNANADLTLEIAAGERIAQLLVVPFPAWRPTEVASLDETARGDGGFGSTGSN